MPVVLSIDLSGSEVTCAVKSDNSNAQTLRFSGDLYWGHAEANVTNPGGQKVLVGDKARAEFAKIALERRFPICDGRGDTHWYFLHALEFTLHAIDQLKVDVVDMVVVGIPSATLNDGSIIDRTSIRCSRGRFYGIHQLPSGHVVEIRNVIFTDPLAHGLAYEGVDPQEECVLINVQDAHLSWTSTLGDRPKGYGCGAYFNYHLPDEVRQMQNFASVLDNATQIGHTRLLPECKPALELVTSAPFVSADRVMVFGSDAKLHTSWIKFYSGYAQVDVARDPTFATVLGMNEVGHKWLAMPEYIAKSASGKQEHVYIMRTDAHKDDVFKIGKSFEPKARARHLSRDTTCPQPIYVLERWRVNNYDAAENAAKKALADFKFGKEFFQLSYGDLRQKVLAAIDPWRLD